MKLIEEARQAWKLWSVRLAALTAVVATIVAANQSIALGLIYFLPDGPWRYVVAAIIGIVVFVIPTITRLAKQSKLENTDAPKPE